MKLVPHRVGLTVGVFAAIVNAVWAVLVALGFAQPFMDWVMSLKFINNPFQVAPFDLGAAVTLVVVSFILGYAFGQLFARVWEYVTKK